MYTHLMSTVHTPGSYVYCTHTWFLCLLYTHLVPMSTVHTPGSYVYCTHTWFLCLLYTHLVPMSTVHTPGSYVYCTHTWFLCLLYTHLVPMSTVHTPGSYVYCTHTWFLCLLYTHLVPMSTVHTPGSYVYCTHLIKPFRMDIIAVDAELQEKSLHDLKSLAKSLNEACLKCIKSSQDDGVCVWVCGCVPHVLMYLNHLWCDGACSEDRHSHCQRCFLPQKREGVVHVIQRHTVQHQD